MKKSWIQNLAQVIELIASPNFPKTLTNTLHELVGFDYSVIFAYYKNAPPIDLYDDFPAKKRVIYITTYQEGHYLLDPFFLAASKNIESGLYRLKDVAPDRFYQSEYFRSYYVQTGLSEEIGFFVNLQDSATVVISLMRSENASVFSAREFRTLKEVSPIVCAVARKHWQDVHQQFSNIDGDSEQTSIQRCIDHAFHTFGKNILTPREREIVEYVLKGYSSAAIGRVLEITTGTVQIHRKNIYSKLGINSQGGLFSLFIRRLTV